MAKKSTSDSPPATLTPEEQAQLATLHLPANLPAGITAQGLHDMATRLSPDLAGVSYGSPGIPGGGSGFDTTAQANSAKNKKAATPTPTTPATPQNLYGFDPISAAQIFQQAMAPYIQQNEQMMGGQIDAYGKMMQQAEAGLPASFKQFYSTYVPNMQQALTNQSTSAANFVAESPAIDNLIAQLSAATNAAKSAGSYASIAPYYQQMIQGGGTTGIGGIGGIGGSPTSLPAMVTPFTNGTSTTAALQAAQAQQNLQQMAASLAAPSNG